MNWDHIEGSWDQFKDNVRQRWAVLSISQLEIIAGNRDKLCDEIQKAYGISKIESEQQIDAWQEQQNGTAYLIERATERNGVQ